MENVKPTKKEEKELIKRVFGNNEKLLKSIYRLFIGLDVPESEKERIKEVFTNEQLREILRQRLLPNLRDDVPIGAVSDEWRDRKSTRLNSSHIPLSRMPSSA